MSDLANYGFDTWQTRGNQISLSVSCDDLPVDTCPFGKIMLLSSVIDISFASHVTLAFRVGWFVILGIRRCELNMETVTTGLASGNSVCDSCRL